MERWPKTTSQGVFERSTAARSASSHANCAAAPLKKKYASVDMTAMCTLAILKLYQWLLGSPPTSPLTPVGVSPDVLSPAMYENRLV
jgi:hypothetical protein